MLETFFLFMIALLLCGVNLFLAGIVKILKDIVIYIRISHERDKR